MKHSKKLFRPIYTFWPFVRLIDGASNLFLFDYMADLTLCLEASENEQKYSPYCLFDGVSNFGKMNVLKLPSLSTLI